MDTSHEPYGAGHTSRLEMLPETPLRSGSEGEAAPRSLLAEAVELLIRTQAFGHADRPEEASGPSRARPVRRRVHQDASDPDQPIAARLMAASLASQEHQAAALADWVRRAHRYLSADENKAAGTR